MIESAATYQALEKIQELLTEAEERLGLPHDDAPLAERAERALGGYRLRLDAVEKERDDDRLAVLDVTRSLQEEAHHYFSGSSAEKIRQLVSYYRNVATESLAGAQRFRDDVVIQLRAMSMVVEMTGSAHTHAEKAARLRGLSEIIEGSIAKLRDMRFDLVQGRWWPDVLRSDYPTRELTRRNRDLEATTERLQAEIRRLKGEPEPAGQQAEELPEPPF